MSCILHEPWQSIKKSNKLVKAWVNMIMKAPVAHNHTGSNNHIVEQWE